MPASRRHRRLMTGLPILLAATSCVPVASAIGVSAPSAKVAPRIAQKPPAAPGFVAVQPPILQAALWEEQAPLFAPPSREPASPFEDTAENPGDQARSRDCLANAIYYEARSESDDGQRAVAQVVLNRVRHPGFPASVCGVVFQGSARRTGCQFSFTCDGSMARGPRAAAWDRARRIAAEALDGSVYAPVGNATHYHTRAVLPYWASSLTRAAVVGSHIFYRWTGRQGRSSAFRQAYAGNEPAPFARPAEPSREVVQLEGAGAVVIHRGGATPASAGRDARAAGVRVHVGTLPATLG